MSPDHAFPGIAAFQQIAREYYPGSNREIAPVKSHGNHEPDPDRWDAKPKMYNGEEFFTIGQLGKALGGRKPVTIRKWENNGTIPKPTFRKRSDDIRGQRRLYSRAQVEGMVKIAEEEGVLRTHSKPITQTNFTERVIALFRELANAR